MQITVQNIRSQNTGLGNLLKAIGYKWSSIVTGYHHANQMKIWAIFRIFNSYGRGELRVPISTVIINGY